MMAEGDDEHVPYPFVKRLSYLPEQGRQFHKNLYYLIGSHKLYFKLPLGYQAIVSVRIHINLCEVRSKKKGKYKICT